MDDPKLLPLQCLNCGSALSHEDNFCPECGQRSREPVLPVGKFLTDFLQDYISFDSRFFRSVFLLLFKPGIMTRDFNSGKRLRFIPPFRLYIFTSFIYFFVLALTTDDAFKFDVDNAQVAAGFTDAMAALDSVTTDSLSPAERADLLRIKKGLEGMSTVIERRYALELEADTVETGAVDGFSKELRKEIMRKAERIERNPELFKQTLFKAISISVFFLLPIFALLLWITHLRRSRYYVAHLVHSLHFHTFAFFLFLFALAGSKMGFKAFWLLVPASFVYFVISLHNAYRQSALKAIVKAVIIVPIYTFVIAIVLVIAVIMGAYLA